MGFYLGGAFYPKFSAPLSGIQIEKMEVQKVRTRDDEYWASLGGGAKSSFFYRATQLC